MYNITEEDFAKKHGMDLICLRNFRLNGSIPSHFFSSSRSTHVCGFEIPAVTCYSEQVFIEWLNELNDSMVARDAKIKAEKELEREKKREKERKKQERIYKMMATLESKRESIKSVLKETSLKLSEEQISSVRKDCRGYYHLDDVICCFATDDINSNKIKNRIDKWFSGLLNKWGFSFFKCSRGQKTQSRCRSVNPEDISSLLYAIEFAILDYNQTQLRNVLLSDIDFVEFCTSSSDLNPRLDKINQKYLEELNQKLDEQESIERYREQREIERFEKSQQKELELFELSLISCTRNRKICA